MIGTPTEPLNVEIVALPGDRGYRRAFAEAAIKRSVSTNGAICLIDAAGTIQVVGVISNDPEVWAARQEWLRTFVEGLSVNEAALERAR